VVETKSKWSMYRFLGLEMVLFIPWDRYYTSSWERSVMPRKQQTSPDAGCKQPYHSCAVCRGVETPTMAWIPVTARGTPT
jgi:hypothetical protein